MYKIVKSECLADKIYLMDVEAPRIARACQPGEFVIVKMDEVGERIPLTICDYDREKGLVTIVFQIVGASTERMAGLKAGDSFRDVVGPLGNPSEFVKEDPEELIAKLLTLTNSQNAAKLRRHIYAAGRVKSENEHGYYIVDAINEAIDTKRKISFYYTDFDIAKQRYVTNDGNPYTVSPYTLIWDGDYYYMRGFCDERQEMRNFRLDRIAEQPKILNQIVVMPPEDYTPADYSKHVFRMYDTEEPVKVQLYCHVSVMKYLIDNFGTDFECEPVDADRFKATVSVCTSTTFYRWVFGFNGKIKIVGPQQVTDEYKEMLLSALNQM